MDIYEFIDDTNGYAKRAPSRRSLFRGMKRAMKYGRVAEGRVPILRGGHVIDGLFWTNGPISVIRAVPIAEVVDLKYLD